MAHRTCLVASNGDPPVEAGKLDKEMYYVYVLKSLKDGKFYVGRTKDLKSRIEKHRRGEVLSTKGRRPLKLVYYEAFNSKVDWAKEEVFLKSGIGRESLKHRLANIMKS